MYYNKKISVYYVKFRSVPDEGTFINNYTKEITITHIDIAAFDSALPLLKAQFPALKGMIINSWAVTSDDIPRQLNHMEDATFALTYNVIVKKGIKLSKNHLFFLSLGYNKVKRSVKNGMKYCYQLKKDNYCVNVLQLK